jgi:hypothetical protein
VHRNQAIVSLVQVKKLPLLLDETASPVQIVPPAMVLTYELATDATGLFVGIVIPYQFVAPVTADVMESPDLPILVADDDYRRVGDGEFFGEVAAIARQLFDSSDVEPASLEDRFAFKLVELRRDGVFVGDFTGPEVGIMLCPAPFSRFWETSHDSLLHFIRGGDAIGSERRRGATGD